MSDEGSDALSEPRSEQAGVERTAKGDKYWPLLTNHVPLSEGLYSHGQ